MQEKYDDTKDFLLMDFMSSRRLNILLNRSYKQSDSLFHLYKYSYCLD